MDKLFALLGMLGNTGHDLILKATAKHRGGGQLILFYLIQALLILLCTLAAIPVFDLGPLIHPASIRYGVPIGVGTFVLYMLVLLSLVNGEVSTNITVFRLNFVVSSVLAVLILGEILTVRKIIGLTFCCAAMLVLFLATPRQRRRTHSGLGYSVLACLVAGGLNVLIKTAFNNGVLLAQVILYRYLTVALLAGMLFLFKRRPNEPSGGGIHLLALFSGAAMMFALYFTFAAFRIGDVALVTPINQLAFVFSTTGAVLIFKEKLSALKIAAIVLAVASIITIA